MERAALFRFVKDLRGLERRCAALEVSARDAVLNSMASVDGTSEAAMEAMRLVQRRALAAARVLLDANALKGPAAEEVRRYDADVAAWVDAFLTATEPKDVAELCSFVRTGNFSAAFARLEATFGPLPRVVAPHLVAGVALVLVVLGVAGLVLFRDQAYGRESRGWPSVEGVVSSAEVVTVKHTSSRGLAPKTDSPATTSVHRHYRPQVTYTYEVNGVPYRGDRVDFGDGRVSEDRAEAERYVGANAVGTKVRVFYDPANHERSVLEPGISLSWIAGGVILLLTLAVLAYVLLFKK